MTGRHWEALGGTGRERMKRDIYICQFVYIYMPIIYIYANYMNGSEWEALGGIGSQREG